MSPTGPLDWRILYEPQSTYWLPQTCDQAVGNYQNQIQSNRPFVDARAPFISSQNHYVSILLRSGWWAGRHSSKMSPNTMIESGSGKGGWRRRWIPKTGKRVALR